MSRKLPPGVELDWGVTFWEGELVVAETLLFDRLVDCKDGEVIRFEREHGRVVRVLLIRKDGTQEEIPFNSAPGAPRQA